MDEDEERGEVLCGKADYWMLDWASYARAQTGVAPGLSAPKKGPCRSDSLSGMYLSYAFLFSTLHR